MSRARTITADEYAAELVYQVLPVSLPVGMLGSVVAGWLMRM